MTTESTSTKAIAVAAIVVVGAVVLLGVDYSQTRNRAQNNATSIAVMQEKIESLTGAIQASTDATKELTETIKNL